MNLAISNIAWDAEDEPQIARLMVELGITGVEIAPTKIWPRPLEVSADEARAYRRSWEDRGIRIVAMQALLYGRGDLTLFDSRTAREETLEYLRGIMRLGGRLGAGPLVFGSPKNRRMGNRSPAEVEQIAVDFFRAAGEVALQEGVVLCIEPNPAAYGCDWVTTSAEGRELVKRVGSEGFGLHLDAAGMTLSGESPEALDACARDLCHFHVSEPYLGPIGEGGVDHAGFASVLRGVDYPNWVSVEMKHQPDRDTPMEIRRVLELLHRTYG